MTTQSNAFPQSTLARQAAAPAILSATRPWYWSVRRELWENRSIYIAPLAVAAVYLCGFLISLSRLPRRVRALAWLDEMHQRHAIEQPYHMAAGLLMLVWMAVGAFYCIDAFQGERRDRSLLFWKSMPVSDVTTVLSKAAIPFAVLPLLTFAVIFILQWTMFLFGAAALAGSGLSVTTYWIRLSLVPMSLLLLYHLVTVHTLLHAPFYAWLMVVSAWARRMAFLWAVLPVLALLALEKLLFNTSHLGSLLMYQLSGGGTEAMTMPGTMPMDPMTHVTPGHFLTSPALWIGLIVSAAFLAAAARLRRDRDPM